MEQETISRKKVIAEFMGAEKSKVDGDSRYLRFETPHAGTKTYAFRAKELKYHSEWNWVIPVWIRFRSLNLANGKYASFVQVISEYVVRSNTPEQLLKKLYPAILWYNSQKETREQKNV